MNRVLILGGGFGGIAAARRLRELLPSDNEIVLVDRSPHFMVGFRKTWALVGESTLEEGRRPIADVAKIGVRVIHGAVDSIEPAARAAIVEGERIEADALVVALGAALNPEKTPGFSEHAFSVYDDADIPRARAALHSFAGGKVVVGIFGEAFKCPAAPYEIALTVRELFTQRGVEASMTVFTPKPGTLPVAGPAACDVLESRLAANDIAFMAGKSAVSVTAEQVVCADGSKLPYDLLLGVAPHEAPAVVRAAGLTQGPWIPVDAHTLETSTDGVYAIGDVAKVMMANDKPLPKAGVFAEGMGVTVAERIAARLADEAPTSTFSAEGGCFLEVGGGEAMLVSGNFLAEPRPEVSLSAASPEILRQKREFEAARLREWFGDGTA